MMTSSNGKCSALLALCARNSPVTGQFPSQRPMTLSFYVFFDLHLNKRLSKQSRRRWYQTHSCSLWCCNAWDTLYVIWKVFYWLTIDIKHGRPAAQQLRMAQNTRSWKWKYLAQGNSLKEKPKAFWSSTHNYYESCGASQLTETREHDIKYLGSTTPYDAIDLGQHYSSGS